MDEHVADLLLRAVAPAALEVWLAAAGQVEAHRAQVDRIWRQRLERAEIATDRARRQYQLAEAENRLVVRQLEKDWESALAEREKLGQEYDRFNATRPRTLTPSERARIRALAANALGIRRHTARLPHAVAGVRLSQALGYRFALPLLQLGLELHPHLAHVDVRVSDVQVGPAHRRYGSVKATMAECCRPLRVTAPYPAAGCQSGQAPLGE